MTESIPSPPEEQVQNEKQSADVETPKHKPLARSRSSSPSDDEPSRKRHRPDTPEQLRESKSKNNDLTASPPKSPNSKKEVKAEIQSKTEAEESAKSPSKPEEREEEEEEEEEEGELPPLPKDPPPGEEQEPEPDGWEAIWEPSMGAYYFFNHHTGETTWTNPRVPPTESESATGENGNSTKPAKSRPHGGYDPSIHGDYDPTAPYAQLDRSPSPEPTDPYVAQAAFNRFTGKFQQADAGPDRFNDENRSKRQMELYFDVDAAANSHDGRSLKAERQARKLSKKEVKAFREKTRLKKEEKKRAWLRD